MYEPQTAVPASSNNAYTYNPSGNRLLSAGADTFSYDDEGQLTDKSGTTYTFDQRHLLTGIGTTTYTYNDQGTRLAANRNGIVTKYIYDASGNLLAEADDSDAIQKYYIYGAGLLAQITASGDIYTYHFNNGGNTVAITDQSQTVVNSYSYTPFGQIIGETENITNPFKFAGQYGIMHESGDTYYVRARYYDASVGRFISEDPSGMSDGPNLYTYVQNNPINFVDPLGLSTLSLIDFSSPEEQVIWAQQNKERMQAGLWQIQQSVNDPKPIVRPRELSTLKQVSLGLGIMAAPAAAQTASSVIQASAPKLFAVYTSIVLATNSYPVRNGVPRIISGRILPKNVQLESRVLTC